MHEMFGSFVTKVPLYWVWVPYSGMLLCLHHRNSKLFLHRAKFDTLRDEKILDYKTVSVAQSCTENCWSRGIMSNFWGQFVYFGVGKKSLDFLKIM